MQTGQTESTKTVNEAEAPLVFARRIRCGHRKDIFPCASAFVGVKLQLPEPSAFAVPMIVPLLRMVTIALASVVPLSVGWASLVSWPLVNSVLPG